MKLIQCIFTMYTGTSGFARHFNHFFRVEFLLRRHDILIENIIAHKELSGKLLALKLEILFFFSRSLEVA